MHWRVVSERPLYEDDWLDIRIADIELPDGRHLAAASARVGTWLELATRWLTNGPVSLSRLHDHGTFASRGRKSSVIMDIAARVGASGTALGALKRARACRSGGTRSSDR